MSLLVVLPFAELAGPEPRGAAQCPTCGRFARIVQVGNDSAPGTAEESYFVVVDCKQHGRGVS